MIRNSKRKRVLSVLFVPARIRSKKNAKGKHDFSGCFPQAGEEIFIFVAEAPFFPLLCRKGARHSTAAAASTSRLVLRHARSPGSGRINKNPCPDLLCSIGPRKGGRGMMIAVASDSPDMNGTVPAFFAAARYLLFIDTDSGELLHALARNPGGDKEFARAMLRRDCEGVLCGPLEPEPFLLIADEGCITRYNAAGLGVAEALDRFGRRSLELIRDHIGGEGCRNHTGGTSCASDCEAVRK
jgi:predicted Fe-Mo cluster-binding NifX family protein